MREFRPYGSVRGAPSDRRPLYRNCVVTRPKTRNYLDFGCTALRISPRPRWGPPCRRRCSSGRRWDGVEPLSCVRRPKSSIERVVSLGLNEVGLCGLHHAPRSPNMSTISRLRCRSFRNQYATPHNHRFRIIDRCRRVCDPSDANLPVPARRQGLARGVASNYNS